MLTIEEKKIIEFHTGQIKKYNPKNVILENYYEAQDPNSGSFFRLNDKHKELRGAVPWGRVSVDVINERLNLAAAVGPEGLGIEEIFKITKMDVFSRRVHRDALVFGCSYGLVLEGNVEEYEPEILMTPENPKFCFGAVNPRTGMLKTFMKIVPGGGVFGEDVAFLMLPNETIYFRIGERDWEELSRETHNRKMVTAAKFVNQSRGSRPMGQSEITNSIRNSIDAANDLLTDMRIAAKTYATPLRYLLDVDPKSFQDADGNAKEFDAYLDKLWVIARGGSKDAKTPVAGQFQASSPAPFIEMVKTFALLVSSETGIPESFFGYHGNQPANADSIKVQLTRLEDRAVDRQSDFEPSWINMLKFAVLIRDGSVPADFDSNVHLVWRDVSVRTPAATADAVTKYISAKILTPDSPTVMRMIGIPEEEIQANRLAQEKAARAAILTNLNAAATAARAESVPVATAAAVNNATEAA